MPDTTQTVSVALPEGFEHLAHLSDWIVSTDHERVHRRVELPFEQLKQFYDDLLPHFASVLRYLEGRPATGVSEADANLVNLALAMVEVSNPVEIYGQGQVVDGDDLRHYVSALEMPLGARNG